MKPLLAGAMLAFLASAHAAPIDSAKSDISVQFRQMQVPVDAKFLQVAGDVQFDAREPAEARASIQVTTASLDIGGPEYAAEIRKPAWFDTAKFPIARFEATSLKPLPDGRFEADGKLMIKGKVLSLKLPIAVERRANGQSFTTRFNLSRKLAGIGDPTWDDVLEDSVTLTVQLFQPQP